MPARDRAGAGGRLPVFGDEGPGARTGDGIGRIGFRRRCEPGQCRAGVLHASCGAAPDRC